MLVLSGLRLELADVTIKTVLIASCASSSDKSCRRFPPQNCTVSTLFKPQFTLTPPALAHKRYQGARVSQLMFVQRWHASSLCASSVLPTLLLPLLFLSPPHPLISSYWSNRHLQLAHAEMAQNHFIQVKDQNSALELYFKHSSLLKEGLT